MNKKFKVYIAPKMTGGCGCDPKSSWDRFNWGFQTLCNFHNTRCCKCGVTRMEHEYGDGTHPFFDNNLKRLEWEYEQKTKTVSL